MMSGNYVQEFSDYLFWTYKATLPHGVNAHTFIAVHCVLEVITLVSEPWLLNLGYWTLVTEPCLLPK